jgi:hypothetical protein
LRAAKDLEAAVQINPREFYAWHNYDDLNSNAGDLGMMNDYSNARRAVTAFTRAIALNPQSARLGLDRTGESRLTLVRPPCGARADATLTVALELQVELSADRYSEAIGRLARATTESALLDRSSGSPSRA